MYRTPALYAIGRSIVPSACTNVPMKYVLLELRTAAMQWIRELGCLPSSVLQRQSAVPGSMQYNITTNACAREERQASKPPLSNDRLHQPTHTIHSSAQLPINPSSHKITLFTPKALRFSPAMMRHHVSNSVWNFRKRTIRPAVTDIID
jgi:hypothetical protein